MKGGNASPLTCEGKDLLISYVTFRNMSDPSELLDRSVRGYGGIRPALLLALLTSQNKFAIFFFRGDVGDNQDSSFGSFASQDMKSLKE